MVVERFRKNPSIKGFILEEMILTNFHNGVSVKRISAKGLKQETLEIGQGCKTVWFENEELARMRGKLFEAGTIYIPKCFNFALLDAFYFDKDCLWLIQIKREFRRGSLKKFSDLANYMVESKRDEDPILDWLKVESLKYPNEKELKRLEKYFHVKEENINLEDAEWVEDMELKLHFYQNYKQGIELIQSPITQMRPICNIILELFEKKKELKILLISKNFEQSIPGELQEELSNLIKTFGGDAKIYAADARQIL
jgi:hypothetical protein